MISLQLKTNTQVFKLLLFVVVPVSSLIAATYLFTNIYVNKYLFLAGILSSVVFLLLSISNNIIQIEIQDNVLYYRKGNVWSNFHDLRAREQIIPISSMESIQLERSILKIKTSNYAYAFNLITWNEEKRALLEQTLKKQKKEL